MTRKTPENLELRYQRARELAQKGRDRALFFMIMGGSGIAGTMATAAYVGANYRVINTFEEIQRGQVDPATQAALTASIGPGLFLAFTILSILAYGYTAVKVARYDWETNKLLKEMENRSKRPPTLGS